MKNWFFLYKEQYNPIKDLTLEQKGKLFDGIFLYQNGEEIDFLNDMVVKMAFSFIVQQFEKDSQKYQETIVRRNQENWKMGGRPKKPTGFSDNPKNPLGFEDKKEAENHDEEVRWELEKNPENPLGFENEEFWLLCNNNINNNNIIKNKKNIISKEIQKTEKNPLGFETRKRDDIDKLVERLRLKAWILWIAYKKTQERNFAKHILDAKEYGEFCEKIGQSREEFALNVMIASVKINYWKGPRSWPMEIYQDYEDVFNLTYMRSKKESEKSDTIWVLPWL